MMVLVTDGQLGDEVAKGIEDRVERIAVAGEDHPRSERTRSFPAEHVERLVDNVPGIGLTRSRPFDGIGDARGHRIRDRARERSLEASSRPKMVKQIGVGSSNLGGDGLQRHRLRAVGDEQAPRRVDRGRPALLGAQSLSAN